MVMFKVFSSYDYCHFRFFYLLLAAEFFQQLCMWRLLALAQIYLLWGPARAVSYIQTKMDSIRMEWGASGVCLGTPTWNLYFSDLTPKEIVILFTCSMVALHPLLWLAVIMEVPYLQMLKVHPTTFSSNLLLMGPLYDLDLQLVIMVRDKYVTKYLYIPMPCAISILGNERCRKRQK